MKPMGREANQLIHAGREAFRPTEADRARLMATLAGTATLSVGAAVAVGAAERSLTSLFNLVPAARLLVVALPLAAVGAYGWHTAGQSPAQGLTAAPAKPPVTVVAPRIAEPPAPPPAPVLEPASEPNPPPSSPERSAPPVGEASKPGNEIRQEVALLSKAQAALSRGRPQEALEALSEHALRFPRGVLTEERTATRARTLCALGRRQEAEAELARMEKFNPSSAYLARARESCGPR
jgi:type IV secretory pathway VirB10-like protein